MVPLDANPIDRIWTDQPAEVAAPIVVHPLRFAGVASQEKREGVAAALRAAGQDACVLTDPPSINWLLNIRGADVAFTPVALAYAIVHADGRADVFTRLSKLDDDVRGWLGSEVTCHENEAFVPALEGFAGRMVRVDPVGSPAAVGQVLRRCGGIPIDGVNPCLLPKACKNATEQDGARAAHRRDGVAVSRFLQWLETASGATEASAAAKLVALRQETPGFREESFPAISARGRAWRRDPLPGDAAERPADPSGRAVSDRQWRPV